MLCTRVLVLIFVLLLAACGVCAALFPLMRTKGPMIDGHPSERVVFLWYEETKFTVGPAHYYTRTYHRNSTCDGFKTAALASAALDVAGCGLAGIIGLLAAAHLCSRMKFSICCSIMVLCFVAFACFVASVATVIFTFFTDTCVNDNATRVVALRDQGFVLVEGFIFLCIAAGGFLIAVFVEIFS
ncbi:hypothetical protein LPMP_160470 [Leishmania panamensis]|uniref:Amastin-like surface protein-like protein n=2 Tax=Leishmania guyanensis species complex TaxID=38579 RepID=A0A088S5V5_LEIPA|nr:hypothetical protein LPMP_160470 [Leishmania panamensis]AIN96921.1 hypothetical protein LPMP_160470 [Leishmania panamensis]CCM15068.1 hypothetical protein, conserved [Leishmania guyanensis]